MARGYSAGQWSAWISEQQDSGLSIAEFCDWIGVSQNAFYVWRRKLSAGVPDHSERNTAAVARQSGTGAASSTGLHGSAMPAAEHCFVPLSVTASQIIEVDLPCGAMVRVPHDDAALQQVLRVLLEAGDNRR